jgi:precorrin-2 dehydrogenase / sirohydrochlorin ferrochelatase
MSLSGRRCVVVGGGAVASRKVGKLVHAAAEVVVVSPEVLPELAGMGVEIQDRPYEYGDLEGANLAFAATGSRQVNAAVTREAKERGVPINVADSPAEGDFAVPSTLRRGGLQVAVSTGGASPMLARRIRNELEEAFGPEWAGVVRKFDMARRSGGAPGQDLEEEVNRCLSRLRG